MSLNKNLEITGNLYGITTTKGDILVNNGTSNVRLGVGANGTILKANSATSTGLEWAASSNIITSQFSLTTLPISTTSTVDQTIAQFTNTPAAGTYLCLLTFTITLSNNGGNATFGIFNAGTVLTDSNRTFDTTTTGRRVCIYIQSIGTFNGSQQLTVQYRSNAANNTVAIQYGNLILIKLS